MRLIFRFLALVTVARCCSGYCWQPGRNPGFTGAPHVQQISRDTLRVDWTGIVDRRECADSFLVKYWPCGTTLDGWLSRSVSNSRDSVDIRLQRRGCVRIQAIAREDKGILGVDYNRSPTVSFHPDQRL